VSHFVRSEDRKIKVNTGSQILDVTDVDVWVMAAKTEHFEQTVEMTNFLLADEPCGLPTG
jgi:hypothetical protein